MLDRSAKSIETNPTLEKTGFVEDVLPTLVAWRLAGIASALVTVVGVDGSSPRPVGSQMAVAIDGRFVGQISSGCAEQAIVNEAVSCLKAGKNQIVRYGKGSPYLDIVLPCGSGIDIFFDSQVSTDTFREITGRLERRQSATLSFDLVDQSCRVTNDADVKASTACLANITWRDGQTLHKTFVPQIQLLALGRGPIVGALAQLGACLNYSAHAVAPDTETLDYAALCGAQTTTQLTTPEELPTNIIEFCDPWTAAVLMFHDHDWEPSILQSLLATDCFYFGAIGSKRTHAQRIAALQDRGCAPEQVARIKGPVGLDIGAQSPPEIALSITAEILQYIRQS